MKKTKHRIVEVVMEEYYSEENGKVYWNYRFPNHTKWKKELTPFIQIPWIEINHSIQDKRRGK